MLGVFLVATACAGVAVTLAVWLASGDRAARGAHLWRRWWRPLSLALVALPLVLAIGSACGLWQLRTVGSTWLAILAGPLAGGDPWQSPVTATLTALPLLAIAALPLRPRWWTVLLALAGAGAWLTAGLVFSIHIAAAGG